MNMLSTRLSKFFATAAGAAMLSFGPAMASAHPHYPDFGVHVVVDPQPCAPVVVDHTDQVWVEPVFRTVCDRVWIAPVVEDRDVHTWVPDRFELQDVVYHEGHHRIIRREEVLVEPAHDVCQPQEVVVTPGHFEDMQRQILVTPGHFEDRVAPVVVEPRHEDRIGILGGWWHVR